MRISWWSSLRQLFSRSCHHSDSTHPCTTHVQCSPNCCEGEHFSSTQGNGIHLMLPRWFLAEALQQDIGFPACSLRTPRQVAPRGRQAYTVPQAIMQMPSMTIGIHYRYPAGPASPRREPWLTLLCNQTLLIMNRSSTYLTSRSVLVMMFDTWLASRCQKTDLTCCLSFDACPRPLQARQRLSIKWRPAWPSRQEWIWYVHTCGCCIIDCILSCC